MSRPVIRMRGERREDGLGILKETESRLSCSLLHRRSGDLPDNDPNPAFCVGSLRVNSRVLSMIRSAGASSVYFRDSAIMPPARKTGRGTQLNVGKKMAVIRQVTKAAAVTPIRNVRRLIWRRSALSSRPLPLAYNQ
jgi:hypothetical protein